MTLTRRTLLQTLGLMPLVACRDALAVPAVVSEDLSMDRAASRPGAIEGLLTVLEEYFRLSPKERGAEALRDRLRRDGAERGLVWQHLPSEAAVEDLMRGDYATGNVVFLKGWCFSRTELRIRALAVLDEFHGMA